MRTLAPLLVVLGALQGCNATAPRANVVSDYGRHQRTPISEIEAETLTNQLNDARTQRDSAIHNLSTATNPEVRRKLQQSVHDYSQMIGLFESRLRAAGRPY